MQYPLSRDEYAALIRCVSGLRRQVQDVSDLFSTRYGKESGLAELAVKALVSCTLLEHELATADASGDENDRLEDSESLSVLAR